MEKFNCPVCHNEMINKDSVMWTGTSNQILKHVRACYADDHKVELKAPTLDELHWKFVRFIQWYEREKEY